MDEPTRAFEPMDEAEYTAEERAELDALDAALSTWAEEVSAAVPLPGGVGRAARLAVTSGATGPGATSGMARPRRPRRWRWGLAAAAAVTLLLMRWSAGPSAVDPEDPSPTARGVALSASELDAASEKPFMLVPSSDPSIAIVWILDTDETTGD